jgi:hypothetical protein
MLYYLIKIIHEHYCYLEFNNINEFELYIKKFKDSFTNKNNKVNLKYYLTEKFRSSYNLNFSKKLISYI